MPGFGQGTQRSRSDHDAVATQGTPFPFIRAAPHTSIPSCLAIPSQFILKSVLFSVLLLACELEYGAVFGRWLSVLLFTVSVEVVVV